jgi:hypothetical protein
MTTTSSSGKPNRAKSLKKEKGRPQEGGAARDGKKAYLISMVITFCFPSSVTRVYVSTVPS